MTVLRVENLRLANYTINIEFINKEAVAFWSYDKKTIARFFDIIAGINNNNNSCFYNDNNIYDNKEYFQARLYFDFRKKYLSTLKLNYLKEKFRQKYNLDFNKDEFKRVSEQLDIRGETEVNHVYRYTKVGNTFVNFALTRSLDKSIIIINNPTINLSMQSDIDFVTAGLTDKSKFDLMILGPDNLAAFAGKLDRICFFSNYTGETITARGDDSLVVVRGKPEDIENVIYQDEEKTIFLNYLTRAELRKLEKEMSLEAVPAEAIDKYVARFET